MAKFQKVKKNTKVYESVIIELKDMIMNGELLPGDYLPPERELAEMMGVSRTSVREALKVLEFMGLIESRTKGGTNISFLSPEILMEKLNALDINANDNSLLDLMELRGILEPKIVEFAVERGSDEELEALKENLKRMRDDSDEENNVNADTRFHLGIARASHNIFFIQVMETLIAMLKETRDKTIGSRHQDKLFEEHMAVIEAMQNRDKAAASAAMENHLKNIKAVVERMAD